MCVSVCVCECECVCVCVCVTAAAGSPGHTVPALRIVTWFGMHGSSVSLNVLGKYPTVVVNGSGKLEEMESQ